jgi:alpha-L-fucosidase
MKTICTLTRLVAACAAALVSASTFAAETAGPRVAPGPFKPELDSLQQYQTPEWFRDAKFGIWAHWGPQAVPMAGDWYARNMYMQGSRQYQHHLENYGHPSTNGYKEIIQLWKAEKWEPDRLMALYKEAGAKYFVSMGSHHDDFFLWNSKLHPWNAVNMGPRRDVVGDWQKAAKKNGLRFGVSEHLGASFTWFQESHKSDKTGPLAGVPYDGANPQFQDLYHFAAEPGDKGWYSNNPRWQKMWFDRIQELVDSYHPDLLYTDGAVPFGNEVGRSLIAHYYNADPRRRGAKPQVVYTCKQKSEGRWVEDLERGVMAGINPNPWQTDTSIGDWYYNKDWKFRPVSWTIQMLVDIVSKNGNLLLNVVQRPDGSLDAEVVQALQEMAAWIKINGEAIYGTRPWVVYGEGPVRAKGGHFGEDFAYTAHDIRFTAKGSKLHAFAMGWPEDGQVVIRALALVEGARSNRISRVEMVGHKGRLEFLQTTNGLCVKLPTEKPCNYAFALQITGRDFAPVKVIQPVPVIRPGANGTLKLEADAAEMHGSQVKVETRGNVSNIGFWNKGDEWVSWNKVALTPGRYEVSARACTVHANAQFAVEVAGTRLTAVAPNTGAWDKFQNVQMGTLEIKEAGEKVVACRAADAASWKALNLVEITLRPVK